MARNVPDRTHPYARKILPANHNPPGSLMFKSVLFYFSPSYLMRLAECTNSPSAAVSHLGRFLVSFEIGRRRVGIGRIFHRGDEFIAQVREENVADLFWGAAAQGIENSFVLAHGFAPTIAMAIQIG